MAFLLPILSSPKQFTNEQQAGAGKSVFLLLFSFNFLGDSYENLKHFQVYATFNNFIF
jgi:hypothetical protein